MDINNKQFTVQQDSAKVYCVNKSHEYDRSNQLFTHIYDRIEKELPFKREWSNGSGWFDYAVYGEHAPSVPPGNIVKSITPGGKRLIIIGTRLDNVVVWDEFDSKERSKEKYGFLCTASERFRLTGWLPWYRLDLHELAFIIGNNNHEHVGWRLEQLFSAMKKQKT